MHVLTEEVPGLIRWMENRLVVTQGRRAGEAFCVLPWQRAFLAGAFSSGINEAGISVGRGNGKSALLAGVALATVMEDGPLRQARAETVIVASSFAQGKILFDHVLAFGGEELADKRKYRRVDSMAHAYVEHRASGARVRIIGSHPKRAHGLAPALVLADEPAQWEAGGDKMFSALKTSRGKIPGSRFIALGTRSSNPLHWFSRMLKAGITARTYIQCHAASDLTQWRDRTQWNLANPSLGFMPDLLEVLESEASDAESDPAALASFQALRLNGGISEVENRDMLIAPELWQAILNRGSIPREGAPVWGLDLGGAAAMSAIVACWPNGRIESLGMFGKEPTLETRATRDGAGQVYALAAGHNELILSGKRIPDIAELLNEAESRFGRPSAIVCDRWRVSELKDELDGAGQSSRWSRIPLILRGQGYKDGAEAVRAWRRACIDRKIYPAGKCILLTYGLSEAVTMSDPAGNEKLAKNNEAGRRALSRDDVVAAALLAVEYGLKDAAQTTTGATYGGLI